MSIAEIPGHPDRPAVTDLDQARITLAAQRLSRANRRLLAAVLVHVAAVEEEEGEHAACALIDRLIGALRAS